jgi:hypothetical protein
LIIHGILNFKQKKGIMRNILYLIAVVLVIIWAVGFIGYHASWLIHILLLIAVVSVLLSIIKGSTKN